MRKEKYNIPYLIGTITNQNLNTEIISTDKLILSAIKLLDLLDIFAARVLFNIRVVMKVNYIHI